MPFPSAFAVAREILLEDLTLETDEVLRRARDKGAEQPEPELRHAISCTRGMLKHPAPRRPAIVFANLRRVNAVVGLCGVEVTRQVAEVIRACGGVDAFLQHLDLVAEIRSVEMSEQGSRGPRKVTAWGETKTVAGWAVDPRAAVPADEILTRIQRGMHPEQAISMPQPNRHFHKAFGQTKTLREWSRDPRCPVSHQGLYLRVLDFGMTVETAFAQGPFVPGVAIRPNTKKRGRKPKWAVVTAWGETKSLAEWAADGRAQVSATMIDSRLRAGHSPEHAISVKRYQRC